MYIRGKNKVPLLKLQLYHIKKHYSESLINKKYHFYFADNDKIILNRIKKYYMRNPNQLPEGLTLHLIHFDCTNSKDPLEFAEIVWKKRSSRRHVIALLLILLAFCLPFVSHLIMPALALGLVALGLKIALSISYAAVITCAAYLDKVWNMLTNRPYELWWSCVPIILGIIMTTSVALPFIGLPFLGTGILLKFAASLMLWTANFFSTLMIYNIFGGKYHDNMQNKERANCSILQREVSSNNTPSLSEHSLSPLIRYKYDVGASSHENDADMQMKTNNLNISPLNSFNP